MQELLDIRITTPPATEQVPDHWVHPSPRVQAAGLGWRPTDRNKSHKTWDHLPLADVAGPGEVEGSRTLRDTKSPLGFSTYGGHMRARALRHCELSDWLSQECPRVACRQKVNRPGQLL